MDKPRYNMKPAEPVDNPGELMAAAMPLVKRAGAVNLVGIPIVHCPLCDRECGAMPDLLRQAAGIYKGRMVAVCSECAMKGNARKGLLHAQLTGQGIAPAQALHIVLEEAKGRDRAELWEEARIENARASEATADLCGCCAGYLPLTHTQITRFEPSGGATSYCMGCERDSAHMEPCERCNKHRNACHDCMPRTQAQIANAKLSGWHYDRKFPRYVQFENGKIRRVVGIARPGQGDIPGIDADSAAFIRNRKWFE